MTSVFYHPVNHPMRYSYPNDYKYPIYHDEKKIGGKYICALIEGGDDNCVDSGDYWNPPVYEPDPYEIIIVQPKLKYWGKGIKSK